MSVPTIRVKVVVRHYKARRAKVAINLKVKCLDKLFPDLAPLQYYWDGLEVDKTHSFGSLMVENGTKFVALPMDPDKRAVLLDMDDSSKSEDDYDSYSSDYSEEEGGCFNVVKRFLFPSPISHHHHKGKKE